MIVMILLLSNLFFQPVTADSFGCILRPVSVKINSKFGLITKIKIKGYQSKHITKKLWNQKMRSDHGNGKAVLYQNIFIISEQTLTHKFIRYEEVSANSFL